MVNRPEYLNTDRPVSAGSYLLHGVIVTSDGNRERVSVLVGVL